MRTVRYQVVSVFTGKRPYAQPAEFTNQRVALAHAKVHGNGAILIDRKDKRIVYNRPVRLA